MSEGGRGAGGGTASTARRVQKALRWPSVVCQIEQQVHWRREKRERRDTAGATYWLHVAQHVWCHTVRTSVGTEREKGGGRGRGRGGDGAGRREIGRGCGEGEREGAVMGRGTRGSELPPRPRPLMLGVRLGHWVSSGTKRGRLVGLLIMGAKGSVGSQ